MKLDILILWPVKAAFVLVVRWEFWLLLLQEIVGRDKISFSWLYPR